MKYIITCFLLVLPFLCFSQLNSEQTKTIDSLEQVIESSSVDTTILNARKAWAEIVLNSNPKLAKELNEKIVEQCDQLLENKELPLSKELKTFYQKALATACNEIGARLINLREFEEAEKYHSRSLLVFEQIGDKVGIATSNFYFGKIKHNQRVYEEAIEYYQLSLSQYEVAKNKPGLAEAHKNLGIIFKAQGNYSEAMQHYDMSYEVAKQIGDKKKIGLALINIGQVLYLQGHNAEAISHFNESLKLMEEIDYKRGIYYCYASIGVVNLNFGSDSLTLKCFQSCLTIMEELEDEPGVARALNNLSAFYSDHEQYDLALRDANRSLKIMRERKDLFGESRALVSLGIIYKKKEDFTTSLAFFNDALKIDKAIGNKHDEASTLFNIGSNYYMQGNCSKAVAYGQKGFDIAKDKGILNLVNLSGSILYNCYKEQGKNKLALQMHEDFIAARDSLESEKNQKEIIKQQFKYEYEKQALADSISFAEVQKVNAAQLATERAIIQKQKQRSYFLFSGLALALLLGGFIYKQKRTVEVEKQKSDVLLLNILPKQTAEELKAKGKVSAQSFNMASVLFIDFKSFTQMAGMMSPENLVREIDFYFSAFDQILEKYNVEKIKTIGDAYMAVGGVPLKLKDHAEKTVNAALEIKAFMSQLAEEKKQKNEPYFEARIGVHSGPLIAGVVGKKKFQYDVWGDTVNIASRMEDACEVGKVNISNVTYQLINNTKAFDFNHRGSFDVKGVGEMEMYYVEEQGQVKSDTALRDASITSNE